MTDESVTFWAPLAPIPMPVNFDGRAVPVAFRLLSDQEEEEIVALTAGEPLALPDRPQGLPEHVEPFWQQDMARRAMALRSAQETRYRLAYAIQSIDGKDFGSFPLDQRIKEVTAWLGGLVDACESAYVAARQKPFQLFEQYEADPSFGSALSNGVPSPLLSGLSPESIVALMSETPEPSTTNG